MPTHNVEINDKPVRTTINYIFPKLKSGYKLRPCQAYWFKHFTWLHYDGK